MFARSLFSFGRRRLLALPLMALALSLAQVAPAGAETFNARVPDSGVLDNPCTGEPIFYEGFVHVVLTAGVSAGGQAHFKGELNSHLSGVSPSGAKYQIVTVSNDHEIFDVEDFEPFNFTSTGTFNVIRQGEDSPEDDVKGRFIFHLTINANGEVTAVQSEFEADCT